MLKEDEEFRYAVAGLLGLEDLKSTLKTLAEAVTKLTDSQKSLEGRFAKLEEKFAELEERFASIEERFAELEGRFAKIEERFAELEEKFAKIEERFAELEARFVTLEDSVVGLGKRVTGLEERVGRLEESHVKLIESVAGLAREVSRLSEVVGFGLEDVARVVVPSWLYRHEGVAVGDLVRKFFSVDGVEVEVNLYGEGLKGASRVIVLGEAKSRIYGDDVDRFYKSVSKIFNLFKDEIYLLMFGFYVHPSAEREATSKGIRLIASYMR